ncbi:MAG: hypothetical protein LBE59_00730 [Nevskiaceae bacterium]|jgi:ribosomal protein S27E|nr:hypothetical protein [Nevskiaceae bacterium]
MTADNPTASGESASPSAPESPPQPAVIDTTNAGLRDGVNRCPKCGSTDVQLRVATGMLMCLFCRYEWSGERAEEAYGLGEGTESLRGTVIGSGAKNIDANAADMLTLKCQGCGAEVVINTANSLSARCHWCRHNLDVNQQVPNGAVPDAVLPFGIRRDDAVARIRAFVDKRRMFALARFKQEFVPENVLGVYLPYMVVDGNASADVSGVGEIQIRSYTRTEGFGKNRQQVTYYDADAYRVNRHVDFTVEDLTLESSAERANFNTQVNTNNVINTILPFDTKNAVTWNASYLTGFSSQKRDQDVQALEPQLEQQLLSIARSEVLESVRRFNRGVRWEQEGLQVHGTRWISMYLPVWLYSYREVRGNRALVHYIAVNARTGETMGSVPIQQWKLILAALTVGTFIEGVVLAILGAMQ